MYRAVVHVPEAARVDRALRNARNLLDDLPKKVEVVLVLNGDAVRAVTPASAHAGAVRELLGRGVRIAVCARSLRNHGLDTQALVEGVVTVPGGVAEVVRLEGEGYAYLRP
jgi:intracellular sulfur oxidation DsrE/DsrF family protein